MPRRGRSTREAPRWPAIVLRTPKGWTGPRVVDGVQVEGTFHSHQVPLSEVRENAEHLAMLEQWLRSYRPDELFDGDGRPVAGLDALRPVGDLRMSATPVANGGLLRALELPETASFALDVDPDERGTTGLAMSTFGGWFAELMRVNPDVRLFGPDEVLSNRLGAVFDVTSRAWSARLHPLDEHLSRSGRVIEALSETLMQGLLEGYLLTGRHGLITSYEAFIHIVDSMFNQHAKWLESAKEVPWRGDVASLNYVLSSHVWRQDHNGFSHQDPGFLNVVVNKQAEIVRVYLPPDANTLLTVMRHVFDTQNRVNVVVAGKQPQPQWLTADEADAHVEAGLGVWAWAGNEPEFDADDPAASVPDIVLACAGDVPTMETVAAAQLLRERLPDLGVRVVNVVDLMRLQDSSHHPHGMNDLEFDAIFTRVGAGDLRLPRVRVARAPARLPAHEPCRPARARVHRAGHHDDAVRHAAHERPRPLPSRARRAEPRARAARTRRSGRDRRRVARGPRRGTQVRLRARRRPRLDHRAGGSAPRGSSRRPAPYRDQAPDLATRFALLDQRMRHQRPCTCVRISRS